MPVVLAGNTAVAHSDDLTTWTLINTGAAAGARWNDVTWSPDWGVFIMVGANKVITSPDGHTWTTRSTVTSGGTWRGVHYANGLAIVVGSAATTGAYLTSTDGITWTQRTTGSGSSSSLYHRSSATFGAGKWVALYNSTSGTLPSPYYYISTSPDGLTPWTRQATFGHAYGRTIRYANGLFVSVASGRTAYSTDGVSWSPGTIPAGFPSVTPVGVAYGDGKWVAPSGGPIISTDGINWSRTGGTVLSNAERVIWHPDAGLFIAAYSSGYAAYTSTDGVSWSPTGVSIGGWQFTAVAVDWVETRKGLRHVGLVRG